MKYYAYINDADGNFDCFLKADTADELQQHFLEYIAKFPGSSCWFMFHGTFVDFEERFKNQVLIEKVRDANESGL